MKHAFVHFESDMGVPRAEWTAFCAEHELQREDGTNTWWQGTKTAGIQCIYGDQRDGEPSTANEVMFLTPWGGPKLNALACLARDFWVQFGGALYAETELRPLIVGESGP